MSFDWKRALVVAGLGAATGLLHWLPSEAPPALVGVVAFMCVQVSNYIDSWLAGKPQKEAK